jgi:L-amino acid N-acyltransferase
MIKIRKARLSDAQGITEVYNEAILKTFATFDTKIKTIDEQIKWFKDHGKKNPIIVAEENKKILGWASLSKYSDRCAYSDTAEISLYVKQDYQGKGIGKRLMKEIIKKGEKAGLHVILARITQGNELSVHLHKSIGFETVGTLKEVGYKFNRRLDVVLMQKIYKN